MDKPNRKLEKILIVAISISFVIWSFVFIHKSSFVALDGHRYFCLFDDAMISMRYAWNFSHGLGLVWNPGERVEGYTNLLMTLLMSFATLIFDKSTAVLFVQILGSGFMLANAYVSMKVVDHIIPDENHQEKILTRILSFFCVLYYYPLAYWSLMGMETGLLTLLLLLGVLSALNYSRSKKPVSLIILAICLGLAYLTRNDSIIFTVFIYTYVIFEFSKSKPNRTSLMWLLVTIGLYSLFGIGQLVFRYLYYGELLPNTYTLKLTGLPILIRISNGVGFVKPFLKEIALIFILASVDLILDFRKQKLLLLSIFISAIGYQVYVGGDAWSYWRIMSPTMPLLFILFICAINALVLAISRTRVFSSYVLGRNPIYLRKYLNFFLVVSFILIELLSANLRFLPELLFSSRPYTADDNQHNVNTAIVISQFTTSQASVGVFWAGSIPYFTGLRGIDFLGKSDKHIAQLPVDLTGESRNLPGHNKYDLNYSIMFLEPTYVQGFKYDLQDLSQWAKTRYVYFDYRGIGLFLLKDSPEVLWSKMNGP